MAIEADRRRLEGDFDPAAHAQLVSDRRHLREVQVRIAKTLARAERTGHFLEHGCASVMEYGARIGYEPSETRRLCDLGLAMASLEGLEQDLLDGKLGPEKASVIGPVVSRPELVRSGEAWMEYARAESPAALRRRVRRRLAEAAMQQVRLTEVTVFVPEQTKDDFDRCRDLASRKAGESLTHDQTFRAVVDHYLECEDPLRTRPGTRRMADTSTGAQAPVDRALDEYVSELERKASEGGSAEVGASVADPPGPLPPPTPRTRTVPEEVKRWIRGIAGDRCEVPGCVHRQFLQFCHRVPFAQGGSQERDNVFLACPRHHLMHDAGRITMLGRDERGQAVFRTEDGTILRHPPPPSGGPGGAPGRPPGRPPDRVAERGTPYVASRGVSGRSSARPPLGQAVGRVDNARRRVRRRRGRDRRSDRSPPGPLSA